MDVHIEIAIAGRTWLRRCIFATAMLHRYHYLATTVILYLLVLDT